MGGNADARKERAREVDRLIGRRLGRARHSAGVELNELADVLEVSVDTAEQFEAGTLRMGPDYLVRAAEFLRVSLAYLFSDDKAVCDAHLRNRVTRR